MDLHDIEMLAQRNAWRLDALDEWRRKIVEPALTEIADKLDGVSSAQKLADEVAKRMSSRTRVELTVAQRAGGFLLGVIAVVDFVFQLAGHR